MDKWKKLEHQYILLTLIEILLTFDLSDEIGRGNLRTLLTTILTKEAIESTTISTIARCLETLIPSQDERLTFIVDIIRNIVDLNSSAIDLSNSAVIELLERDPDLKVKVSSIKLKILDLQEQEMNCVQQKDYVRAEKFKEELAICNDNLTTLIGQIMNKTSQSTESSGTTSVSAHYCYVIIIVFATQVFVLK